MLFPGADRAEACGILRHSHAHLARFYFCRVSRKRGSIHVGTHVNAVGAVCDLRAISAIHARSSQRLAGVLRKLKGYLGNPGFLGTLRGSWLALCLETPWKAERQDSDAGKFDDSQLSWDWKIGRMPILR